MALETLTRVGAVYINIQEIKSSMWNIIELDTDKCLINFKGKTDLATGQVINRAPLILECSLARIMSLIENSEPAAPPENIMKVTKDMRR